MCVRQTNVVLALLALLPALAAAGVAATRPTTGPVTAAELETLRRAATAPDSAAAVVAIRRLVSSGGTAGREAAAAALPTILDRDARLIRDESNAAAGGSGTLAKLRLAERGIAPLRAAMLDAAARMSRDPEVLKALKAHYDRLAAAQAKLSANYSRQLHTAEALARRTECADLLRAAGGAASAVSSAEAETVGLRRIADSAWEIPAAVLLDWTMGSPNPLAAPAAMTPPENPAWRGVWFYAVCRRIETYNRSLEGDQNAGEIAHVKKLNAYREMVGLWPYEVDLRLTQAARRHSKEMFDLKYFSHWSPTPGQENYYRRDLLAGYSRASSENICLGAWTGPDAFAFLFNSPSHHHAWLHARDTAIGVGKWENAWTESFGAGPRLMLATDEDRAATKIVGEVLKPQASEQTRQRPRENAEYKFYDPNGREVPVDASRVTK